MSQLGEVFPFDNGNADAAEVISRHLHYTTAFRTLVPSLCFFQIQTLIEFTAFRAFHVCHSFSLLSLPYANMCRHEYTISDRLDISVSRTAFAWHGSSNRNCSNTNHYKTVQAAPGYPHRNKYNVVAFLLPSPLSPHIIFRPYRSLNGIFPSSIMMYLNVRSNFVTCPSTVT